MIREIHLLLRFSACGFVSFMNGLFGKNFDHEFHEPENDILPCGAKYNLQLKITAKST